jgi:hypothetical protein
MDVRLDLDELDLLRDMVQHAHDALEREIGHSDTRTFRETLKVKVGQYESILKKLDASWRSERP